LVTFAEGNGASAKKVETGALLLGNGTNTTGTTPLPTGSLRLVTPVFDTGAGTVNSETFELTTTGSNLTTTATQIVSMDTTASNTPIISNTALALAAFQTGDDPDGGGGLGAAATGFKELFAMGVNGSRSLTGNFNGLGAGIFANYGFSTNFADGATSYSFAYITNSDGNFVKDLTIVPEPASVLVWSMIGLCVAARRRFLA
jgi:hypothetical protein